MHSVAARLTALMFVFVLGFSTSAGAQTPSPSPTQVRLPADADPPGTRNPLIGALAAAGIIVTAAAGYYVYRTIRKGL